MYDCINKNQEIKNLIKLAYCWHLSPSKMVHNWYENSFLWILEKNLSKINISKFRGFFSKQIIQTKIKNIWQKMVKILIQNWKIAKDHLNTTYWRPLSIFETTVPSRYIVALER